jgi:hypothetical protein
MHSDNGKFEEKLAAIIVDGQRCDIWVRSEPDEDGTWHNAVLFRRDTRVSSREALVADVEWQVPPGIALDVPANWVSRNRSRCSSVRWRRVSRSCEPLICSGQRLIEYT